MNNITYYYSHGFNVLDGGERTLNTLRAYLYAELGGTHIDLDYGWSGLASVSLCNNRLARSYAEVITAPAVFVGHSNGCAIQAQAIEHGAKVRGCVWVAPAMPHDWVPPRHIRFVHVYYDPDDWPIALGAPLGGPSAHRAPTLAQEPAQPPADHLGPRWAQGPHTRPAGDERRDHGGSLRGVREPPAGGATHGQETAG